MKKILTMFILLLSLNSLSQWQYKVIKNDFDDPFKKAYTKTNNNGFLAIEEGEVQFEKSYLKLDSLKLICETLKLNIEDVFSESSGFKEYALPVLDSVKGYKKKEYIGDPVTNYKNLNNEFLLSYTQYWNYYYIETTSGGYYVKDFKYKNSSFTKVTWNIKDSVSIRKLHHLYINYNEKNILTNKTKKPPILFLVGTYFCDQNITVDIVLTVKGISKKYSWNTYKSKDSRILFFYNILNDLQFIDDFKNASHIKLRVNESHCRNEYYEFNMSGSNAAFNFIIK